MPVTRLKSGKYRFFILKILQLKWCWWVNSLVSQVTDFQWRGSHFGFCFVLCIYKLFPLSASWALMQFPISGLHSLLYRCLLIDLRQAIMIFDWMFSVISCIPCPDLCNLWLYYIHERWFMVKPHSCCLIKWKNTHLEYLDLY